MIKKILSLVTLGALLLMLCSCSAPTQNNNITVVVSVFSQYDWLREIIGNVKGIDVILLADGGADIHSLHPTADHIISIKTCNLLAMLGGASDSWIGDALRDSANPDMKVIDFLELVGEGALCTHHDHGHHEHGDEIDTPDEHMWLSLKNAVLFVKEAEKTLSELSPENASVFHQNAQSYIEKLEALDREYALAASNAQNKTLIFCDRFPFAYLLNDYGLNYIAAFEGCSAESEADFETVIHLAKEADRLNTKYLFVTESRNHRIAESVVENRSGGDSIILTLDSIQTTGTRDNITYLQIMENNLFILQTALQSR